MTPEQELRFSLVERDQGEVKVALQSIRESLESLVRLEERHAETRESILRAFKYCEDLELRIEAIEKILPGLQESRAMIVGLFSMIVVSVVAAIVMMVIK